MLHAQTVLLFNFVYLLSQLLISRDDQSCIIKHITGHMLTARTIVESFCGMPLCMPLRMQALQGKALVRLGSTRSETHARACSSRHHRAPEESTASAAATGSSNSPAAGASVRTRKGEAAVQEEEVRGQGG